MEAELTEARSAVASSSEEKKKLQMQIAEMEDRLHQLNGLLEARNKPRRRVARVGLFSSEDVDE